MPSSHATRPMLLLNDISTTFFEKVQRSAKFRTKVILFSVLGLCFCIIAFILFVRTVVSFSYPKYAFEFMGDPFGLSETFPQMTFCPGPANYSSQTHELIPGKIERVECIFHDIVPNDSEDPSKGFKETRIDVQVKSSRHMVEFKTFDCYDVNYDYEKAPTVYMKDNHSYLGCRITSNSLVRFHAYPFGVAPTNVWTSWTSVKNGEATQLAIRANEFALSNGYTSNTWYEVVREDEELRWEPSSQAHSLYVSVSFVYLSKRRLQQFFTYDLITTLGVTGGVLLMFKLVYDLLMKIFSTALKDEDEDEIQYLYQRDEPSAYSAADIVPDSSAYNTVESTNVHEQPHNNEEHIKQDNTGPVPESSTTNKAGYDEL